jgi:hypothetical protein
MLPVSRLERAAIVKPEVAGVVVGFGKHDTLLAQDPLKQPEVDRLVIDDDPVEIQNQSAEHDQRLQNYSFVSTEYTLQRKV